MPNTFWPRDFLVFRFRRRRHRRRRHRSAEAVEKKIFGPSARKFFSRNFFFGSAGGGWNKQTKTSENLELWRKSRTLAKILNFGENLGLWRKSRTLAKISNFDKNLELWRADANPPCS